MLKLVDTHCHLDFPEFEEDRETIFSSASDAGVVAFISIGIDPASWQRTHRLVDGRSDVLAAYGVHPNAVEDVWSPDTLECLGSYLDTASAVALGEIGLDFYRSASARNIQMQAFDAQLALAKERQLPVIIHTRSAEDETIAMLQRYAPVRGVMHCFSSSLEFAERCLDLGLMLGVGGISTYPSAENVREALRRVPLDKIVLETDAPFLAPQSHRGKRNEPAFVRVTAERLATTLDLSIETVAQQTTANAIELFGSRLGSIVGEVNRQNA